MYITGRFVFLTFANEISLEYSRLSLIRGPPDWPVFLVLSEPRLKRSALFTRTCTCTVYTRCHSACTTHVSRLERSGWLPSTVLTSILYTKISMINAILLTMIIEI